MPWSGIVRLECSADLPATEVIRLADLTARLLTYPAAGVHSIVAAYSGAIGFFASTSPALTEVVSTTPCTTLAGCNLSGANLSGASLNKVIWSSTICPDGTNSNNDGDTCVGHL